MDFGQWVEAEPGRASTVAAHFKVGISAVSQWKRDGVPLKRMKAVRDFSGGEVTLEEMVPPSARGMEPADSQGPSHREAEVGTVSIVRAPLVGADQVNV